MTTVQNVVSTPGGTPVSVNVRVTLITGSAVTPGYTTTGDIVGVWSEATDDTGAWSTDLTPNSQITPANTYYQVLEGSAVSNIVVPASGGPYLLVDLIVTPPTPSAPGITGVQVASGGTVAGVRPEINLIAGSGITVTAEDNASDARVDVTLTSTGGGGAVDSVNEQTGTVVLTAANVGADAAGAAAAAQAAAQTFATGAVATETSRAEGVEAAKLTAADNLSDLTNPAAARTSLGLGSGATANIDATAGDIQPLGTVGAGSTGKLADAGHRHPYAPWQFYVGTYGAKGDNSTDDTGSINNVVAAAFAYAQAHNGYAEILFDPLTYLIAGAPTTGGSTNGSAQIPLPVQAQTAQKITLVFRGTRDQTGLYHWLQTTPQRAGTVLRSTWNAGDSLPATGEASVIGGPTPHYMSDPPTSWDNLLVVIDGVTIEIDNYNICGFDFRDIAEASIINASVLALSTGTGAPAVPPANWAFGLAMPVVNNNDCANIGWFSVEGMVYGLIVYEHVEAASVRIINCFDGLICWSSSGFPHGNRIGYASIEGCQRCIVLAGGFNKLDIGLADIEWGGSYIIDDAGSIPGLGRIGLRSNGDSGASLNAALNTSPTNVNVTNGSLGLEIINLDQALGPVTAPSIPGSGTALTNPFWRSAQINITGGTVTEVAIDGVNQLSTSGGFALPPGHAITLTYSVAPSWAWTLTG